MIPIGWFKVNSVNFKASNEIHIFKIKMVKLWQKRVEWKDILIRPPWPKFTRAQGNRMKKYN